MWENWSGSVAFQPKTVAYPHTQQEIVDLVKANQAVRVVGSGHSFAPLVQTDAVLVSLERFTGIEAVDTEKMQATVRAGTTIKQLGEWLYARGLAQENLGDIDEQSIAGAISTGTHGSGVGLGSLATQVVGLKLVTAYGDVISCSEAENRDIFKAAQVSLGALGIITHVTLQLVPAFALDYRWEKMTIDQCLANLEPYKRDNRNFEFYWMPHTDQALGKFMNMTDTAVRPHSRWRNFEEMVIENGTFYALSELNRMFPRLTHTICKVFAAAVQSGHDVNYGHRIFATPRLVKFQEMEYNIPAEHFAEALLRIESEIARHDFAVHFPIECRFVQRDDIYLSPAYERDSAYIAVHMYKGMPYRDYFAGIEAIMKDYDGRPHWGKMHTLQSEDLRPLYPRWDDFQNVRQDLDPNGVFLNKYLREVLC